MFDIIIDFFSEVFSDPTAIMGYFWLIAALILLLLEMTTPGLFFFVAFAFGAICAAIAAFLGVSLPFQMWISVFGGVVSFFILKHLFLSKKITHHGLKTNTEGLIGQDGLVIETINPHQPGVIKVKSELWGAVLQDGSSLQKGTQVKVVGIHGNKLVVRSL
ncbi:MAG: hypothetical protein US49_C0006G0155 [candidate division TM6 bacterium GW2011_GWF2_37_49]|nr:MAG: hypothetical protein US49_C0006G0155 [candidate division TM6 bacterium GW2011_GWF2_37_49]